ncbi:CHAP domain-containing protein [Tenacibaculum finnmarkense genomovar finnmarkense]|uniref:CHAP domain-containing protein n=1 Tax=Tenacibaculum finnmarkense TaxID=2781243 RepID=UPI001E65708B|nr:CHAP domain-containing protein [Tenacibaculum finnmarkense]MCD8418545.1 CHAP domain-containing protein [Tenacibaculum finnmarkense genomovar finnmarkense]MCG8186902.1 CHAP domain-containing protein [Tenacibaculum finnmarkense genomovar finnmarkense]MCG8203435.1 CHAP domain-containing protein [Tenacibaculum finnmarkense genomovar finnmarkense]MCG8210910.1 CHAP domain-containing protein [Tenacibaculum finnmarkense genomovar finnmarkense]MCG8213709.1 CHAP domain-containing protein [Tenacibacul
MVPFAWEKKHGSIAEVPRYFYLKYESEEFPRAYYTVKINTKNETDKKDSVKGMRVSALMLKVAKTLQLKNAIEGSNAVVLGEELSVLTGSGKACESLIWGEKFTCTERKKVIQIAENLGIGKDKIEGANWLMAVMALETGGKFDPSIRNSLGYTGLIQFGKSAAKSLGTTRDNLRKMTVVEQLDYVEKYFKQYKSKLKTITDVYLSVLYPVASGHGEEKNYVVFDDSKKAYKANPTFFYEDDEVDKNSKGKIIKRHGKIGGKTYIWEVKMAILTWYSKGSAKNNMCKKDASTCEFGSSAGNTESSDLNIPAGIKWLKSKAINKQDFDAGTPYVVSYKQEFGKESNLRVEKTELGLSKMDCSELVCRYLNKIGWSKNVKWLNTSGIINYAVKNVSKLEKVEDLIAGDIFVWKGHTGVVIEVIGNKVVTIESISEVSNSRHKGYDFDGVIEWGYELDGGHLKGSKRSASLYFFRPKKHYKNE